MAAAAALALIYEIKIKKHNPEDLLVNRLAAEAAAKAEAETPRETEGGLDGSQT